MESLSTACEHHSTARLAVVGIVDVLVLPLRPGEPARQGEHERAVALLTASRATAL